MYPAPNWIHTDTHWIHTGYTGAGKGRGTGDRTEGGAMHIIYVTKLQDLVDSLPEEELLKLMA